MTSHQVGTRVAAAAFAAVAVVGLAACGSSGSKSAAASTPVATSSSRAGAGRGFGIDAATRAKIQTCLKAAGIAVPTRSPGSYPRPTGSFTGAPNGQGYGGYGGGTAGPRPTGTGGFRRFAGGAGGGFFNNPQAAAALKACGITVPSRPAGAGVPSGGPTGAPGA